MTDVFPRRNLSPDAEEWGREVENRIYQVENRTAGADQTLLGLSRSSSATLDNLALQIAQVEQLYNSLPVSVQRSASISDFAVPNGGAWNTLATITLMPQSTGTYLITTVSSGQLRAGGTSTLATADYRFITGSGAVSPVATGLWADPPGGSVNNFLINWGWSITSTGSPVSISLQARPGNPWPAGTGSYAVITLYGTFTRG